MSNLRQMVVGEGDYRRFQLEGAEGLEFVTPIYFPLQSSFFEEAFRVYISSIMF